MAKIDISSISGMTSSAGDIRKHILDFQGTSVEMINATAKMKENWQGEAADIFENNANQAKKWMDEMVVVVNNFAKAIDEAAEKYQTTDSEAAKAFH